jgi:hypothetical protein
MGGTLLIASSLPRLLAGATLSEGGFAPNKVAAASVLDVQEATDKKGKKYYKVGAWAGSWRFLRTRMQPSQSLPGVACVALARRAELLPVHSIRRVEASSGCSLCASPVTPLRSLRC